MDCHFTIAAEDLRGYLVSVKVQNSLFVEHPPYAPETRVCGPGL